MTGCSTSNEATEASSSKELAAPTPASEPSQTSSVPMSKTEAAQTYLNILCESQDPLSSLRNLSFDQTLTQSDIPKINTRVNEASSALTRVADKLSSPPKPWPTNLQDLVLTLAAQEVVRVAEFETLLNPASVGDFEQQWEAVSARLNQSVTTVSRDIRRELGLPARGGCPGTIFTPQIFMERVRNMDPRLESVSDATLIEEIESWCQFITVPRDADDVTLYIPESAIPVDSFVDFVVGGTNVMCSENTVNATY